MSRAIPWHACFALAALLLASCQSQESMPKKWEIGFEGKTIGDMISDLGPPQEDASAKQFLNWVETGKEATLVLKVGCPATCDRSEKPASVWFLTVRPSNGKVLSTKLVFGGAS